MLWKLFKNCKPTFARSQSLITPEETDPICSSLMPASVTTKSQVASEPSSQINQNCEHCVIAYASRKLQVAWNASRHLGVWIILVHTFEKENLRCLQLWPGGSSANLTGGHAISNMMLNKNTSYRPPQQCKYQNIRQRQISSGASGSHQNSAQNQNPGNYAKRNNQTSIFC